MARTPPPFGEMRATFLDDAACLDELDSLGWGPGTGVARSGRAMRTVARTGRGCVVSGPTQDWRAVEAAVAGAPPDRCRRIAVAAAGRALDAWPGHPPTLDISLAQVLLGPVAGELRAEAQGIGEELDARYLDLYDEEKPGGRTPGWDVAFRRARAAAAVVRALDDDARVAASGALYEASYALDEDLTPLAGEVA